MFQRSLFIKSDNKMKEPEVSAFFKDLCNFYKNIPPDILQQLLSPTPNEELNKLSTKVVVGESSEIIVYFSDSEPLFFACYDYLFPTVYALWKFPELVVPIIIRKEMIPFIRDAEDVMLPSIYGLISLPNFCLLQGCSVQSIENSAAFASGRTRMSSDTFWDLKLKNKKEERVVEVLHYYGDYLWAMGSRTRIPQIGGRPLDTPDDYDVVVNKFKKMAMIDKNKSILGETVDVSDGKSSDDVGGGKSGDNVGGGKSGDDIGGGKFGDDVGGGKSGDGVGGGKSGDDVAGGKSGDGVGGCSSSHGKDTEKTPIPDSMDELMKMCFLYGLKKQGKNIKLPMLAGTFYQNHVMVYCPLGHSLEVKKSRHKKVLPFLKSMQQLGLIEIEELSKGAENITHISLNHDYLRAFRIPNWELQPVEDGKEKAKYVPPKVKVFYKATKSVLPLLFSAKIVPLGTKFTESQVRYIITNYAVFNELKRGRSLYPDAVLKTVIFGDGPTVLSLPWEHAIDRVLEKMDKVHEITFPGQDPVTHIGDPKIIIEKASKLAHKSVTLVKNLQPFGFQLKDLILDFNKSLSCRSTIIQEKNGTEVLEVQGHQSANIKKRLTEVYKIEPIYIDDCQYHYLK